MENSLISNAQFRAFIDQAMIGGGQLEVCTVRKQHLPFPKIKTSIYVIQTVVLEKTLESPLDSKEINLNTHWKD